MPYHARMNVIGAVIIATPFAVLAAVVTKSLEISIAAEVIVAILYFSIAPKNV